MTIKAKIVCDSVGPDGVRLTTFQLKYHRMVHSELLTHRDFSRNSSSSRAIPVLKMIGWVEEDPAIPVEWGKNQAGMQAGGLLEPEEAAKAEKVWLAARDEMIVRTKELIALNVHKQIANRLLEPWHHISVVLTATRFTNWFALRWHEGAQPEIRELAKAMAAVYRESCPEHLLPGQWHLPYIQPHERAVYGLNTLLKVSVARCARVSYMKHDGTQAEVAEEVTLHDKLAVQEPLHASPTEHQGTPLAEGEDPRKLSGNLIRGWKQYRKTLPRECVETFPWDKAQDPTMTGVEMMPTTIPKDQRHA